MIISGGARTATTKLRRRVLKSVAQNIPTRQSTCASDANTNGNGKHFIL